MSKDLFVDIDAALDHDPDILSTTQKENASTGPAGLLRPIESTMTPMSPLAKPLPLSDSTRLLAHQPSSHFNELYHDTSSSTALNYKNTEQQTGWPQVHVSEGDLHLIRSNTLLGNTEYTQHMEMADDVAVTFRGYTLHPIKYPLYIMGCIATAGVLWLLVHWSPHWAAWVYLRKARLDEAMYIIAENSYGEKTLHSVYRKMSNLIHGTSHTREGIPLNVRRPRTEEKLLYCKNPHYFEYRCTKLIFDYETKRFFDASHHDVLAHKNAEEMKRGVYQDDYPELFYLFGANSILVKEKSLFNLLFDEILHPFNLFQVASITLWMSDEYYYYAGAILIMSVYSIVENLIETRKNYENIRNMCKLTCDMIVLRDSQWTHLSSDDLVPGDVVQLHSELNLFPCDAILLEGDCIMDESMLTGESIPVTKTVVKSRDLTDCHLDQLYAKQKHVLYNGTKVVRVRSEQEEMPVKALVLKTGFNTTKGAMIRSILHPKPTHFRFYTDSLKFVGILAMVALFGFMLTIYNLLRLGNDWTTILKRSLDLFTIVVPPALPATMAIGVSYALRRLRLRGISCISPTRINVGGKLSLMVWDKTGTLTTEGLDIYGTQQMKNNVLEQVIQQPGKVSFDAQEQTEKRNFVYALASCHALRDVKGSLVGDPVDLRMFEFTGWNLIEPHATRHEKQFIKVTPPVSDHALSSLEIIHSFDFVSHLRRMSVLVRYFDALSRRDRVTVFVKGAPEVIRDLSLPESLPDDFDRQLDLYTQRGLRVIAIASKEWNLGVDEQQQELKRSEVEHALTFQGLVILENKVKTETKNVLDTLHKANFINVMSTGDNILTAISVARLCGIVQANSCVFHAELREIHNQSNETIIHWQCHEHPHLFLDPLTLTLDRNKSFLEDNDAPGPIALAMSGQVLDSLLNQSPPDVYQPILCHCRVFARMSPDQKQRLVCEYQNMGACVGMCGDGANDCGALKAAHVGVSLSETDASIAAPFTANKSVDILSVPQVVKEGRAALVTSFSCFKYMAVYSIIQFTSVSILYFIGSNIADLQFLYIDLFLVLPLAILMGRSGAYDQIVPKRPTASLVSRKVIVPMLGQMLVQALFQILIYWHVQQQSFYRAMPPPPNTKNNPSFENSAVFLFSNFQYVIYAMVFSIGRPYRQSMYTNRPFILWTIMATVASILLLLCSGSGATEILGLVSIPWTYGLFLLFMALVQLLCAFIGERVVFPWIANTVPYWLGVKKQRKRYKFLLDQTRQGHVALQQVRILP